MHTILIAADQKNKGNISPTGQVHFIVIAANYIFNKLSNQLGFI